MDKNKAVSINGITNSLHDGVDDIYESLMDGEFKEVSVLIDAMVESLKHLKSNIINDEV